METLTDIVGLHKLHFAHGNAQNRQRHFRKIINPAAQIFFDRVIDLLPK